MRFAKNRKPPAKKCSHDNSYYINRAPNMIDLWQGLTTLLSVYDGSDNLLIRFKYADSRMPIAMEKQGSTYYLCYDQVGSLRAVADSSGNVVKQISYDTFGYILKDIAEDPPFEIPFGFAGGLNDRDTGLVRFGYRDYDPDIGRWTAKDPIFFSGGDTDLYGYVLNDPVNFVDPLGLDMMDSYWNFHGKPNIPHSSDINLTPPSKDSLKNTQTMSQIMAVASYLYGNVPMGLLFQGISFGAIGLDVWIYSDEQYNYVIKEGIKSGLKIPYGFDILSDEIINQGFDSYINNCDLPHQ